jgi:hypothetical protein
VQLKSRAQARGQILILTILVPVLILLISLAATYAFQEDARSGRLVRDADRSQELLRLEIDEATDSLHTLLDGLQEAPGLSAALAANDAAALDHRVAPIFAHLRDQHGISHLYFTRPDRSPLLRLDGSGKSGQVVDRLTLFDAAENAGSSDGLDLNAFGVVTLRVTVGWRDMSGKLIGFVEIGRDVAPMIDAVHRVMGLDILLLVKKDLLDRDKWEEGARQSGGQGGWDELANAVSVARTLPTIPTAIGLMLEDGKPAMDGAITIVGVGKRSLAMSVRPLIDLQKKPIGDVVLLRDVTATSHTMAKTLLWIFGVGVSLIALAFWRCRWLLSEGQDKDPSQEQPQNA